MAAAGGRGGIVVSWQHLESFAARRAILMVIISSSSLQEALGVIFRFVNMLHELLSPSFCISIPHPNALYMVSFTYAVYILFALLVTQSDFTQLPRLHSTNDQ